MSDAQAKKPVQECLQELPGPPSVLLWECLGCLQGAVGEVLILDADSAVLTASSQKARDFLTALDPTDAYALRRALGSVFPSRFRWPVLTDIYDVRCIPVLTEPGVYYVLYFQAISVAQNGVLQQLDADLQACFFDPTALEALFLYCLQQIPAPQHLGVDHIWFFHFLPQFKSLYPAFLASRQAEVDAFYQMLDQDTLDWQHLERVGHRLKGSGGSYGFLLLSVLGAAIEQFSQQRQQEALVVMYRYLALYVERVQPCVEACMVQDRVSSEDDVSSR